MSFADQLTNIIFNNMHVSYINSILMKPYNYIIIIRDGGRF